MPDPACLTAALDYHRRGLSPIPLCPPDHWASDDRGALPAHVANCQSPGKAPLFPWKPYQEKAADEKHLRLYWQRCPTANVGIALGPVSGMIALDIDGPEAEDLLTELHPEPLPRTLGFGTPGGGRRLFFRCPPDCQLTKRRWDRGTSHVILMGKGSQTVMPPSIHPNGKAYAWEPTYGPDDILLAQAPPSLLTLAQGEPHAHLPHHDAELPHSHRSVPRRDHPPAPDAGQDAPLSLPDHAPAALGPDRQPLPVPQSTRSRRARAYARRTEPAISGQGGHDQTFKLSCKLVKGFCLSPDEALAILLEEFNPRCQPPWTEQELRHKVQDAARANGPEGYLAQPQASRQQAAGSNPKAKEPPRLSTYNARDLLTRDFPEMLWAVPGLIPEGATLLAGPPKTGKSWLTLGLCLAVAAGGTALGSIATPPGDVLYLALEDGPRRLKKRITTLLAPTPAPTAPASLHLSNRCPRSSDGGFDAVEAWLDDHEAARLVVVDTLAKIRDRRAKEAALYEEDYAALEWMQTLGLEHHVAFLIIHHTRKAEAEDPLETVSGTMGLTGAADTILVLKRQREATEGTLFVTGRDVDEVNYTLSWDKALALWTITGQKGANLTPSEQKVFDVLTRAAKALTPLELTPLLHKSYEAVKQLLKRMADDGLLIRDKGSYRPADVTLSPAALNPNPANGLEGDILPER